MPIPTSAAMTIQAAKSHGARGAIGKDKNITSLILEKIPNKAELQGEFEVSIKSNE